MLYQTASREDTLMSEWIRIQKFGLSCLQTIILFYSRQSKVNIKVKQSSCRPGVAQRVPGSWKVPRFCDNGTGWW